MGGTIMAYELNGVVGQLRDRVLPTTDDDLTIDDVLTAAEKLMAETAENPVLGYEISETDYGWPEDFTPSAQSAGYGGEELGEQEPIGGDDPKAMARMALLDSQRRKVANTEQFQGNIAQQNKQSGGGY
jgi:hypothetical protein